MPKTSSICSVALNRRSYSIDLGKRVIDIIIRFGGFTGYNYWATPARFEMIFPRFKDDKKMVIADGTKLNSRQDPLKGLFQTLRIDGLSMSDGGEIKAVAENPAGNGRFED